MQTIDIYHIVIAVTIIVSVFVSMMIPILDSNMILDSIAVKTRKRSAHLSIQIFVKLLALERY